jgi:hypothetical protein
MSVHTCATAFLTPLMSPLAALSQTEVSLDFVDAESVGALLMAALHAATAWTTAGLVEVELEPLELLELDDVDVDAPELPDPEDELLLVVAGLGELLLPQPAARRPVDTATKSRTRNGFLFMTPPFVDDPKWAAAATICPQPDVVSVGAVSYESQRRFPRAAQSGPTWRHASAPSAKIAG